MPANGLTRNHGTWIQASHPESTRECDACGKPTNAGIYREETDTWYGLDCAARAGITLMRAPAPRQGRYGRG